MTRNLPLVAFGMIEMGEDWIGPRASSSSPRVKGPMYRPFETSESMIALKWALYSLTDSRFGGT